jgi:hypothetical protein
MEVIIIERCLFYHFYIFLCVKFFFIQSHVLQFMHLVFGYV